MKYMKNCVYCNKKYYTVYSNKMYCCEQCKYREKLHRKRSPKTGNWHKINEIKFCEICGLDQIPEILQVHHLNGRPKENKAENLLKLCPNCHISIHRKVFVLEGAEVSYIRNSKIVWVKEIKKRKN